MDRLKTEPVGLAAVTAAIVTIASRRLGLDNVEADALTVIVFGGLGWAARALVMPMHRVRERYDPEA